MNSLRILLPTFWVFASFLLSAPSLRAQNLSVRQIMAEPSIAGTRAEGEKISPNGDHVIFLWNAEGKLPRDLYLVSTNGGDAKVILKTSELPAPSRPPEKEDKLDYGLIVRDEFVKLRENQFGNFEWSPDSNKLVFTYGGDLYVFNVEANASPRQKNLLWTHFEAAVKERAATLLKFGPLLELTAYDTEFITKLNKDQKDLAVSMQSGGAWDSQRQIVLQIERRLSAGLDRLVGRLPEAFKTNADHEKLFLEVKAAHQRTAATVREYEAFLESAKPKRYTRTQAPEGGPQFLDNDRIMYMQGGNLFVLNTADATVTQISKEANPQAFVSVFNGTPNKPGTLIAYVVSDSSKQKALVVPNYLGEFTAAPTSRRGWTDQKIMVIPADASRDTAFEIKLPKPEGVSGIRRIAWAADNSSLVVDRIDKDTKRRQLFYIHNVGSKGEQIVLVTEETDPKWQASLSAIVEPNPNDTSQLIFGSEKDGFNHLYLAEIEQEETRAVGSVPTGDITAAADRTLGNVTISQLTKGNWQVEWAKWAGGSEIVYLSTQDGAAERAFYSIYMPDRKTMKSAGFDKKGTRTSPQISEDGQPYLLYELSQWDQPGELHAVRICPRCRGVSIPRQLTQTVPESFAQMKWNEPKFIEITSRDGKKIPAKIYVPANFNPRSKSKYPMVVFVHGAGYLQNVINGWNNYYREFMFNQLLTQKGYVVLDIDYRGSAGYGRDWRTDVHDFLGGKDMDDHVDAIDHMVANYAVNKDEVGVYGGSYGGFMAGMLAMRAPDKVAAAAALRPVFDWKNYYASSPGYTAQRLGFPDKNPEAYKRSSPITYAEKLERPLLILHGMSDDNVHVQDSVQLMEKLIRIGKSQYVEAMLYPSENHAFVRPESWTDEYERILAFFEKHLK